MEQPRLQAATQTAAGILQSLLHENIARKLLFHLRVSHSVPMKLTVTL